MTGATLGVRWRTGGAVVATALEELGVRHVFSLPGSQVLPRWDAIDRHTQIEIVVPRTERSGAFMAEGYAQASGGPSLVMSTLGPGVANELVGLRSAQLSQAAVVSLGPYHPQAKRPRLRDVFQGLDHPSFVTGACKWNLVVDRPGDRIDLKSFGETAPRTINGTPTPSWTGRRPWTQRIPRSH